VEDGRGVQVSLGSLDGGFDAHDLFLKLPELCVPVGAIIVTPEEKIKFLQVS